MMQDKITIRGAVETFAYFPEYKAKIDRILKAGKGSPKDNWMPEGRGDWQHQFLQNAVVDGKKICAAMLAYENLDGLCIANPNRYHDEATPNQYIQRPVAMTIKQNTGPKYYQRWIRGDDERLGSICNDGNEYARFIVEVPDTDTDSSVAPWFNANVMTINEMRLNGPWRVQEYNGLTFTNLLAPAKDRIDPANPIDDRIAYPISLVSADNGGTYYQRFGWPEDYTLTADRRDIRITNPLTPSSTNVNLIAAMLYRDLTNDPPPGKIFSSITLNNPIPKDDSFALAIVWKILFS